MHELSLMQSILEIVENELKTHGYDTADVVKLKVGELVGIEESSMQFAFEVLSTDTALAGAKLILDYVPGEAYCTKCALHYPIKRFWTSCPQCGGRGEIVAGKELYVDSLEVDDSERD